MAVVEQKAARMAAFVGKEPMLEWILRILETKGELIGDATKPVASGQNKESPSCLGEDNLRIFTVPFEDTVDFSKDGGTVRVFAVTEANVK